MPPAIIDEQKTKIHCVFYGFRQIDLVNYNLTTLITTEYLRRYVKCGITR